MTRSPMTSCARLFAAVSREEMVGCVDNIGEWVTGKRSDLFHGIVRRHGMLRKFSPALLDALELTQDTEGEQSACLRALQMLKELNATGRRKLPEDAPTDFLPQRLKPIVINHGEIDRRAWECALLLKLRDELKAGNLSVRYSKRFARLEEFFIGDRRWQSIREDFFRRSGLPSDTKQVQEYLARRWLHSVNGFQKRGICEGDSVMFPISDAAPRLIRLLFAGEIAVKRLNSNQHAS
jgi:hypothetical protein